MYKNAKNLISKIQINKLSQSRDTTPIHSVNNSFREPDNTNNNNNTNYTDSIKTLARVGSVVDLTFMQRKSKNKNYN
jgi:hypothetical protein